MTGVRVLESSEFVRPDWSAPLDVEAVLASSNDAPPVAGFHFRPILDKVREMGLTLPNVQHVVPFRRYPRPVFIRFLIDAAQVLWPDASLRLGLRRLGQLGFQAILQTTVGQALLEATGRTLQGIYRQAPMAFAFSRQGRHDVVLLALGDRFAHFEFSNMTLVDTYYVGVLESPMLELSVPGRVWVQEIRPDVVEFLCEW